MNDAAAVGPVYTSGDLSAWLGVLEPGTAPASRTARTARRTVYPAWQFTSDRSVRPGVREVLEALAPVMDDWTLALWCSGASPDLGGKSVANWLSEDGDPSTAAVLARRTADRWAH